MSLKNSGHIRKKKDCQPDANNEGLSINSWLIEHSDLFSFLVNKEISLGGGGTRL